MATSRVLLVGCGAMSRAWLREATQLDDVEIVGYVDLNRAVAEERHAEFGPPEALIESDLDRALATTRPDVVFDITIPAAHTEVTQKALAAGCHVLGEKPLTDNMADARKLVEAAARRARLFAVVQNRRYLASIVALRAFLASGALGRITTVNADFYLAPHFGGFRDAMRHVLLLDMAIHTFDQARALSGTDPQAVYCHEFNPAGSWYAHGASAQAIFEMTDGVVFNYRGSWCAEGRPTAWEAAWRIVGERGTVTWDGKEELRAEVVEPGDDFMRQRTVVPVPAVDFPEAMHGHSGVIRDFFRCLRTGDTPPTAAADNLKSLAMVFGAIESAEKGARVEVVL